MSGQSDQSPSEASAQVAPRGAALAYGLLIVTTLGWAGNAVAGRLAVGTVAPMTLICLRWVIVVAILGLLARRVIARALPDLAAAWRYVFLWGALGFTLFNALYYLAAYYTGAVQLTLFQGATPALVILGSRLVYGERVRGLQVLGLVLALAGVAIVAGRGSLASLLALDLNRGDALMLVACTLNAAYALALRRRPPIPDLALFAGLAAGAFVSGLPLAVAEIAAGAGYWPTRQGWLVVAFVATVPSLVCQLCFLRAVTLLGPARAGLFVNLVPVFGALLAVGLLGEEFRLFHAAALALVLGGIALAEFGRGRLVR